MTVSTRLTLVSSVFATLFVVLLSDAYGQSSAIQRLQQFQDRLKEAERMWKNSAKLTLLEKVPDKPRHQTECISPADLTNDSVGYLDYWQFFVLQVVGPKDVILTMRNHQVPAIWLTGHSTQGLADEGKVIILGLVEVDGSKTYTTVTGAQNTIRVVRLLSRERIWEAWWAENKREWTDKSGKFSVVAAYDEYLGDGKIRLRKLDGSDIVIPLSKLSGTDRRKAIAMRRASKGKDDRPKPPSTKVPATEPGE